MLALQTVHSAYGNIRALRGISLTVERGEVVTLIGSNGAGKTTTLRTIMGLLVPRAGQITLEGQRIEGLATDRIVRLGIAQSPEGRRIFPRMSVLENLEMGAFARRDREQIPSDLEHVFQPLPTAQGTPTPAGRDVVRWGATDAGHGPGLDGAPQSVVAG